MGIADTLGIPEQMVFLAEKAAGLTPKGMHATSIHMGVGGDNSIPATDFLHKAMAAAMAPQQTCTATIPAALPVASPDSSSGI